MLSRLAVDLNTIVHTRAEQKTPRRIRPTCAQRPQLLCGSDGQYRSIARHGGRLCFALGRVAYVAAQRREAESVADAGRGFGDLCQYCDLDCARSAGAVAFAARTGPIGTVPDGTAPKCNSLNRTSRVQTHVEIIVHRRHQHVHFLFVEMVGPRDFVVMDGDVPLRAQLIDQFLDRMRADHFVTCTMDDYAR